MSEVSKNDNDIYNETINSMDSMPNFLILFADDLGYGDLAGTFGHPTSSTPNLKKLADEAKVFTNFYVASSVCSPSRAALLTGKYPVQTGIYPGVFKADSLGGLSLKHDTIATKLYKKGYATAHIGKWHLGVGKNKEWLPTEHGFETYCGIPYSHDMCPCEICFPDGRQCNNECPPPDALTQLVSCPLIESNFVMDQSKTHHSNFMILEQPANLPNLTNVYTEKAIDFIENSISADKPFFLYMAYHQTHNPQFSGPSFFQKSDRGPFGDALEEMDDSIGKILKTISVVRNETVVIFSSDNGPSIYYGNGDYSGCAGPLRCGKGTTWDGGQRVPGMISQPGKIKPGVSHALTSTIDIMPTILSIVGENIPMNDVGYDLSEILFDNGSDPRDVFLYYPSQPESKYGVYAARHMNYKAHFYTQGAIDSGDDNYDLECRSSDTPTKRDPPLLYDINKDPGERFPIDNNSDLYQKVMTKLLVAKKAEEAKVGIWEDSEMDKGRSEDAEICCNEEGTTCTPFPKCCNCRVEKISPGEGTK